YIIKRLLISIVTIFVLAGIVFFLIRLLPGDPFLNEKVPDEIQERMREYYGLNEPVIVQFFTYLKNLIRGDMGYSLRYKNRSVNEILFEAFPYSADLGIRATIFALLIGVFLGIVAAKNKGRKWDNISMIIAIIGVSVPSFIIGSLLQYFLAVKLKILPVAQYTSLRHTLMPTFALGLNTLAVLARLMRTSMIEVVSMDFIKNARAKGLSEFQITWKHQIRNAILPVVTILGTTVAALLTGTFVIENIFAIPGLGKHYVLGIQNLDYSMVSGLTLFFGTFLVATQFIVDILYGFIDPRIRIAGRGGKK
ncbi:MAG: ABC transporter permease, partial [Sediminispirochaetaceae bacterium]